MKKITHFNWLYDYIRGKVKSKLSVKQFEGPAHILFLFVDHFELAGKEPRLSEWLTKYPELASKHIDSDGCHPKHTWFYALDLIRESELEKLQRFVKDNLGEIELHWHHGYDTEQSFKRKLAEGLRVFQNYNFMNSIQEGKPGCFGFIHGNWSLDNSCGRQFCGVDNEIELLKEAGCYADFTFPALYSDAQPQVVNKIFYAVDNGKPKSYNKGRIAEVLKKEKENELMIFEGPLSINWRDWRFRWHPTIENGEVGKNYTHRNSKRIDAWVNQRICVEGRPEWIFVKIFCHGGQDYKYVLSDATDEMFRYLEEKYNDGNHFKLHYVTAREAYNIVKAAENGKSGNPHDYRDYLIPKNTF